MDMKTIKVLGTGCANCRATVQRVEDVAKALGVPINLEKIEGIQDIMAFGVLATPGVVVDDEVVHSGGVPSRERIEQWLTGVSSGTASMQAGGCCGGASPNKCCG